MRASPSTRSARTSPLAEWKRRPATWSTCTSPEADFASTSPSRPRAATSADAVGSRASEPSGQRIRTPTCGVRPNEIQAGPMPKPLPPMPISTTTSPPLSSTVACSIASRVASSSRSASSSTVVSVGLGRLDRDGPAGLRMRSRGLPGVSNACTARLLPRRVGLTNRSSRTGLTKSAARSRTPAPKGIGVQTGHVPLLSAVRVAGQTPAGADGTGTRLEPALERAHDPRVDGGAVAGGGDLDLRLQPFGQAQGDSGRERVVGAGPARAPAPLLLLDVDELGIAAGEADLDAAGNRGGERERRLADDVEQAQVERGAERLA